MRSARRAFVYELYDSWWALVVVYPTFTLPFCTWLMLGFFRTLPPELEEAAWVDGCGLVGGIVRVVLPLSRPGQHPAPLRRDLLPEGAPGREGLSDVARDHDP